MHPLLAGAAAVGGAVGFGYLTSMDEEDEDALAGIATSVVKPGMDYWLQGPEAKTEADDGQTSEPTQPESYGESMTAAEALAEPVENESPYEPGKNEAPPPNSDVIISDGAWKYQVLGGGKIKFVGVPPGSKMMGKTLDPEIIKQMPLGPARDRLQRSYDSIKSVAQGGKPLMHLPSKPKAASTQAAIPEQAAQMGARLQADAPPPAVQPTPAPVEVPTKERMGRTIGFLGRMRDAIPNYWDND